MKYRLYPFPVFDEGFYLGDEDSRIERLRHIGIRSAIESGNSLFIEGTCSKHQYRDMRSIDFAFKSSAAHFGSSAFTKEGMSAFISSVTPFR